MKDLEDKVKLGRALKRVTNNVDGSNLKEAGVNKFKPKYNSMTGEAHGKIPPTCNVINIIQTIPMVERK